jgi:hypothetical protein
MVDTWLLKASSSSKITPRLRIFDVGLMAEFPTEMSGKGLVQYFDQITSN